MIKQYLQKLSLIFVAVLLTFTLEGCYEQENPESMKISDYAIGDTIVFGTYPSDYDSEDDVFKIADLHWQIVEIDEENNRIRVRLTDIGIDGNVVDAQPFNATDESVKWDDSTLKKWLNSEFINIAFTDEQKALIIGDDAVFLPKWDEFVLDEDFDNRGRATEYAFQQGVWTYPQLKPTNIRGSIRPDYNFFSDDPVRTGYSSTHNYCYYWIMDEDKNGNEQAVISKGGKPDSYSKVYGVIPEMWLDLSANK